jgi:site-specific recombinase XerD
VQLSAPGFSRMIERAAITADLGIKAHAHMLRHASGYKLANDGHDTRAIQAYLGNIATFRIRRAIPRWRRSGSKNFFEI